jgi:hypothetical protein
MSRDTILARIKLTADNTVLAKRATNRLADLSDCAVGVDYIYILGLVFVKSEGVVRKVKSNREREVTYSSCRLRLQTTRY